MGWYEKYLRHKLNSVYVPSDEFSRLRGLSSSAPGPTPWSVGSLPSLRGPNDLELRWRKSEHMQVVLGDEQRREDFLAFGGYCYILPIGADRLCSWYHVSTETVKQTTGVLQQLGFKHQSKIRDHSLRLTMIDTRSLKPLPSIPNLEVRRKSGEPPVEFLSNAVAETNITYPGEYGKLTHQFPDAMRSIKEVLVLGSVVAHGPRNQSIWVVKPSENMINVLPMDWWNDGDYDYGYEWVTKLARDPKTGNIVGEGIRILPFLLDESGSFLGWIEESK
jgi:hypothetical protein